MSGSVEGALMRPDVGRPDVDRPGVDQPGVDQPGVDLPDVESGPFARSMSAQGDHVFHRVKTAKRDTESTAVSRRQTLYPTLLSGAVTIEAPQVGGVLQRAAAGEASDQNDPDDYDSDNTSDGGDEIAGAPRTLPQKKKLRMKRRDRYMSVRRASPLGDLDPRGGTRRLIAQLRATPGM